MRPSDVCAKEHLRLAAMASLSVYGEPSDLGHKDTKVYSAFLTSATAWLIKDEELDVLVFKGSKEPIDFLYDLSAAPIKYGTGWKHIGFALAHRSIWGDIVKDLDPEKELIVTGHSLGAVMGEISCDFLRDFRKVHLIVFGKPNGNLKCKMPEPYWHLNTQLSVVNSSDVVPRVPRFLFGPEKHQDMLYFNKEGEFYLNPSKEFMDKDRKLFKSVSHHSMERYLQNSLKAMRKWDEVVS